MKKLLSIIALAIALQAVSLIRISETFISFRGGSTAHCPQDNSLVGCYPVGAEVIPTTERGWLAGFYNNVDGLYLEKTPVSFAFWFTVSAVVVMTYMHRKKLTRRA